MQLWRHPRIFKMYTVLVSLLLSFIAFIFHGINRPILALRGLSSLAFFSFFFHICFHIWSRPWGPVMIRSLISQFSFLPSRPKEALTKIGKHLPCSFQEEVKNVICPTDNDGWRPITYGLLGNSGDLKINDICFGIQNLKWHDRCNWEFVFFWLQGFYLFAFINATPICNFLSFHCH